LTDLPYADDGDGVRLAVRVTPRARLNEIGEIVEDQKGKTILSVRLAAPPVEGAANTALVAFLAERLGVARSAVAIVMGATGRRKIVRISGLSADALAQRL
jgi:uncharacterized protein (TIGR00251 family)